MTNPKIVQPRSKYPLHKAIYNGDMEQVNELLARGADLFKVNENGKTPLNFVAQYGTDEIKQAIQAHINKSDEYNQTALHYAALNGESGQVKQLLQCGANINAEEEDGKTPLEFAMLAKHTDVVKLLINRCDENGVTPLHHAALKGKAGAVAAMIEHGADLHAKDKKGNQPDYYAAEALKMRLEMVRKKMHEQNLDPAKGIPKVLKAALLQDHMVILEILKKAKDTPEKTKANHHSRLFDTSAAMPTVVPNKAGPKKPGL